MFAKQIGEILLKEIGKEINSGKEEIVIDKYKVMNSFECSHVTAIACLKYVEDKLKNLGIDAKYNRGKLMIKVR